MINRLIYYRATPTLQFNSFLRGKVAVELSSVNRTIVVCLPFCIHKMLKTSFLARFPFLIQKMSESAAFSIDIGGMRTKYKHKEEAFTENQLVTKEPMGQFKLWFDLACQVSEIEEPNAMCLATCSKDGVPSARYVLLKGYGKDGFRFYTNYSSRKGQDLTENPRAALVFYWECLKRSIRIEGAVEKLPESESVAYFHSRPKESQLGAVVSHQSTPIPNRDLLVQKQNEFREAYATQDVPKPAEWGGFIVQPSSVEFWQGQSDRLHDRIRFRRLAAGETPDELTLHTGVDGWVYERLAP